MGQSPADFRLSHLYLEETSMLTVFLLFFRSPKRARRILVISVFENCYGQTEDYIWENKYFFSLSFWVARLCDCARADVRQCLAQAKPCVFMHWLRFISLRSFFISDEEITLFSLALLFGRYLEPCTNSLFPVPMAQNRRS